MHRTRTVQEARADFANICQVAKDEGITVFTIGFDVQDGSKPMVKTVIPSSLAT